MKLKFVKCPICRKDVEYSEKSEYRPFCSMRCKTMDIAAWASEDYKVPSREPVSEFDLEEALEQQIKH